MCNKFKLFTIEADENISFLCSRCTQDLMEVALVANSEEEFIASFKPGTCTYCYGEGVNISDSKQCFSCKGTGVCSVCNGHYSREWTELPEDAKLYWLDYWKKNGDTPETLQATLSLHRNW
jgi:putative hemolysin